MLRFRPFRAVRPRPEFAADVASVPYDAITSLEARKLALCNPRSFLHVSRAEIDLPPATDPYADIVYETARRNFDRLLADGTLLRDSEQAFYLYRQDTELSGRSVTQIGVVGCCHVDDYAEGVIKRHERTRQDKEDDRTRHLLALNANSGPVFLMYRDQSRLSRLVEREAVGPALYDFHAADGVRHRIWRVARVARYQRLFSGIAAAYIADGHHRAAAAARVLGAKRAVEAHVSGNEEYNWFLAVLFPASQLNILPYHRLLKDLAGLSVADFLTKLRQVASITESATAVSSAPGQVGFYVEKRWYVATWRAELRDTNEPVQSLDYVLLSSHVLAPILGVGDLRTDQRIEFVGGSRGTAELERRVDTGECAVAFAMPATTIEQLLRVADANAVMPPKSTWFEPKLRSGLLVHTLD